MTTVNYAAELASLKTDLNSLRNLITTAVEQLKTEIASLHATPTSSTMETEIDHSTTTTPEISDLIADLKRDIATIALEMREKFKQQHNLSHLNLPQGLPACCNQCGSSK